MDLPVLQTARSIAKLWWMGMVESLQLQRCVVICVYDKSNALLRLVTQCCVLNGTIYLGSILGWQLLLQPALRWLLGATVQPAWGWLPMALLTRGLELLVQAVWLFPAYIVMLIVNAVWYQSMAGLAYQVIQRVEAESGAESPVKTPKAEPKARAGGSSSSSSSTGSGGAMDTVAQELYRTVLFMVFYAEVYLLALLPYIGRPLNLLFLSWLYAFYCFDYKWGLMKVRLPERLAHFERRWAFFGGFGLPLALLTVACPFYLGAALIALVFPLFILAAAASCPDGAHDRAAAPPGSLGQLPIFRMALAPTDQAVRLLMWPVQAVTRYAARFSPGTPATSSRPSSGGSKKQR